MKRESKWRLLDKENIFNFFEMSHISVEYQVEHDRKTMLRSSELEAGTIVTL